MYQICSKKTKNWITKNGYVAYKPQNFMFYVIYKPWFASYMDKVPRHLACSLDKWSTVTYQIPLFKDK